MKPRYTNSSAWDFACSRAHRFCRRRNVSPTVSAPSSRSRARSWCEPAVDRGACPVRSNETIPGVEPDAMTHGVTLDTPDTQLTHRAATLLAAGPADAQTLISYVCQLPGAPPMIAEHMATALFAGHTRFARRSDGRWCLRESAP